MKEDKKNLIYYQTLKHAAKFGISDIKTPLLAKEIGIAEGSIFYHFKDMKGLIDYCALRYDRELMEYCIKIMSTGKEMKELWDELFDHVLKEPDGGVYYFDYVNYYGFDPTETNNRSIEFLEVARTLFKGKEHLSDHKILILWDYMTTQLFYYVNKIYDGYIEDNQENRDFIKQIVFATYDNI